MFATCKAESRRTTCRCTRSSSTTLARLCLALFQRFAASWCGKASRWCTDTRFVRVRARKRCARSFVVQSTSTMMHQCLMHAQVVGLPVRAPDFLATVARTPLTRCLAPDCVHRPLSVRFLCRRPHACHQGVALHPRGVVCGHCCFSRMVRGFWVHLGCLCWLTTVDVAARTSLFEPESRRQWCM